MANSGPRVQYGGLSVEFSCFEGSLIDYDNGALVLHLQNFTGEITLRSETVPNNCTPSYQAKKEESELDDMSAFDGNSHQSITALPNENDLESLNGKSFSLKHQRNVPLVTPPETKYGPPCDDTDMEHFDTVPPNFKFNTKNSKVKRPLKIMKSLKYPDETKKQKFVKNATDSCFEISRSNLDEDHKVLSPPPLMASAMLLATNSPKPLGRWGHASAYIGNGKIIYYGGQGDDDVNESTLGDVHVCTVEQDNSVNWSKLLNCDTDARAWHTVCYIEKQGMVVAFGGECSDEAANKCIQGAMVLETDIHLFYPLAASGKPPAARSGHTSVMLGKDIILFGGCRGRRWQNSLCALDTEKMHWLCPPTYGGAPKPRSYHSATVIGAEQSLRNERHMVIFGGNNEGEVFNDVTVLEAHLSKRWEWSKPTVSGVPPTPRTGHSAVLLPDGVSILIVGGWDPVSRSGVKYFEDAFVLSTVTWEWRRAKASLRYCVGQSCTLVTNEQNKTKMLIFFGGQDKNGVRNNETFGIEADMV